MGIPSVMVRKKDLTFPLSGKIIFDRQYLCNDLQLFSQRLSCLMYPCSETVKILNTVKKAGKGIGTFKFRYPFFGKSRHKSITVFLPGFIELLVDLPQCSATGFRTESIGTHCIG